MADDKLIAWSELAHTGLAAAALVHELRQPVFALQALAARAGQGDWTAVDAADLADLTGHLGDVLRGWDGVGAPEGLQLHDALAVVHQAVRMLDAAAGRADAVVTVMGERSVWCGQRPMLTRQVVFNLVHNALDAVRDQPSREVSIQVEADECVRITVRDSGPGIRADVESTLFEPLVTGKGDHGTGLGLYVVRMLCRSQNGDVTLEREGGQTVARAWFSSLVAP